MSRISSWRGVYVEYDPEGKFMMIWDGIGFLGTAQTKENLWEAVRRARKGSPPCDTRFDPKPKIEMSEAERMALIAEYIEKHPNVRVPVRSELKDNRIPTEEEINTKVLMKKFEKMGIAEREEMLKILQGMETDNEIHDLPSGNREDGSGPDGA
jgi:hypothetical protein